jgi:hypothetical protein
MLRKAEKRGVPDHSLELYEPSRLQIVQRPLDHPVLFPREIGDIVFKHSNHD